MCVQTQASQKSSLATKDSHFAGVAGEEVLPNFLALICVLSPALQDGDRFEGRDLEVLGHRCGV